MATATTPSIGTRAVRGMFWAYGSYVGGRLLSLVAMAILARVLLPEDFGLVALALTFMAFLDLMQGLGVSEALVIGEESELNERAETAFAINVGMGFVLALVTAAIAPVAASFFHEPRLLVMMPVLGVIFVLRGLGATHAGLALKSIDFQSRTIAELAEAVVRGVISVAVAVAGGGVWSLIVGYVVGTAAWNVAIWRMVPWRPHFRPKRRHVRSLLRFGGSLTGVAVMAAFMAQFDNIVIGRVLGPAQLGFYSIATRLPYLLIVNLAVVAGRVLFPAFAALRERGEMERAVLTSLRYTSMVTLPLTAFMFILAEPLIIALFGDRWRPAIGAMQVLCLWALMTTFGMILGNMFKACARPDIILKLAIPQALALVVGSLVFVRQGIVAVSWVQAAIAIAAQLTVIVIAQHLFGLTVRSVLNQIRPAVLASAGLAAVLLGLRHLISAPWLTIIAGGVVGSAVYLGVLLLLAPDTLKRLRTMAFAAPTSSDPEIETVPGSKPTAAASRSVPK
jgi:polysaccharide transporter, PST family